MAIDIEIEEADGLLLLNWSAADPREFTAFLKMLKKMIPVKARSWNPQDKVWIIHPAFKEELASLQRMFSRDNNKVSLLVASRYCIPDPAGIVCDIPLYASAAGRAFVDIDDLFILAHGGLLGDWVDDLLEFYPVIQAAERLLRDGDASALSDEDLNSVASHPWLVGNGTATIAEKLQLQREEGRRLRLLARSRTAGFIYVIRSGDLFKIGRTTNLRKRLAALRGVVPGGIRPVRTRLVLGPRTVEKHLHEKFADKRTNGEWFALSQEDVAWLKKWTGDYEHRSDDEGMETVKAD